MKKTLAIFIVILASFVFYRYVLKRLIFADFGQPPRFFLQKIKIVKQKLLTTSFGSLPSLEKAKLEAEIISLNKKIKGLEKELEMSQKIARIEVLRKFKLIPGKVLKIEDGRMVIDVGSADGILVGQSVVFEDFLIGVIEKADSRFAYVKLPLATNSKISVKIVRQNSDKDEAKFISGVLVGKFNLEMMVQKVLQKEAVSQDDLVESLGTEVLPGFLIGKVAGVAKKASEVFQTIKVTPLIDYRFLEQVFVLKD